MKSAITFAILLALSATLAWGQATAQIHGTVQDMSGAGIPGATVKATQTDTQVSRTVTSGADGGYVLTNLPLGPYRLDVSKEGFATEVESGIVLLVNSDPAVPVSMRIGGVSEHVVVEANASAVETRAAGVGTVIESQQILDLPLNGRQPTDLITLSGLAVQTGTSPAFNMNTGVTISVAGGSDYSVQYNLDGASHIDNYDGTSMPLPFPDALQEFRLVTSTQDAAGGGHSGAAVDAVTKSGSNAFHGDAFEFFRNGDLNGRDFFSSTNDHLKRNQFGGVIGGPIKKDKFFFFLGYQGTITRQTPAATPDFVPTAAMRNGDFSAYIANNCPETQGLLHGGAFGRVINGQDHLVLPLSPAALAISARLPQPTNVCGQVLTGDPLHQNNLQAPVRLDYQLSPKQSLFARYLITRIEVKVPYSLESANVLTTDGVGNDDTAQSLTLGDTYLITSNLVNSFRAYGNRIGGNNAPAKFFGPSDVGVKNFYGGYDPNFMSVYLPGDFSLGFPAQFLITQEGVTNFGFNDDVSLVRGSHQFAFGVNAMRGIVIEASYAWSPGVMIIPGAATGSALADFLSGTVTVMHQANPNPNYTTQNFFGLYAGDTWKATSRLTLNYGVRWNPFFPTQFMQSDVDNFSLARYYANERSTVIPSAPPGFTYPGDPGFNGRSGLNHAYGHFEPRLGFAWDPFGDGKTSIRGGAGTAYDFIAQDLHQNTSTVAPFRETVIGNFVSLDNPYARIPGGNPFPYFYNPKSPTFPTQPLYQGFYPFQPNLKTSEQYSWNFGIQRQVTPKVFVSATYVGSQIIHVSGAVDLNPAQYIPGNCQAGQYGLAAPGPCTNAFNTNQRRLLELTNPAAGNLLGSMTQFDDGGTQHYNGLLLKATYRMGNSVNLSGNYTWSHCIGFPGTFLTNLAAAYPHQPYQNNGPQSRALDSGDCYSEALDIRQIANITLVANTPRASGGSWLHRLANDWTFSTIYTYRTGPPLTVDSGADVAENGLYVGAGVYPIPQRPNQVLANTAAPNRGQSCSPAPCVSYFNPAAFADPAPGTYGNMGVADLRGPGFWEWDQTVSRQFRITENQHVEFRVEAFNVTNSVRLYITPGNMEGAATNLSNGQFGRITSDASTTGSTSPTGNGGRIMQLALKYVF